ncbi:MAG TPA: hypothetical protein VGA42_05455 [Gemmatimonadales bacterium]
MDSQILILVLAVVAAGAALAVWLLARKRRAERMQIKYGPEYERVIGETGNERRAAKELDRREKRIEKLHIRPLTGEERVSYAADWHRTQEQFVDDPARAVAEADRLVQTVMAARGYPVVDFEQRVADVSVDHPRVVEHYRAAHAIALRYDRGEATTEDLRQALVHDRALFEELLEEPAPAV